MLHIIEGPAGSGKTTKAYDLLLQGAGEHKDRTYILVIPEQSSISAQKDIIDRSPRRGILNIDILSFNRLAHRIFQTTGGEASELIDDSGKNLIIRRIADDIIDDLTVLKGGLKKQGYISEVRSVLSEFMQYGISPEDLKLIAENAAPSSVYLSNKLRDVSLIYEKFRDYMGSSFMTREELLVKASAQAQNAAFLKNSVFIFDSFTGFTPVQYMFLEALLTQCLDIYVCLTRDPSVSGNLFSLGDTSFEKLESIAERHGGVEEIWLEKDLRHKIPSDINTLGTHIFSISAASGGTSDGSVSFFAAYDPYEEVYHVMRQISDLIRERGYHYRDCGILMGNTALYADIVRSRALSFGIPVYVDQTRYISLNPFTELIRALISVIKEDYSYPSVFHLLRSGLTDIVTDDIDRAENYILATGIRGRSAYEKPFKVSFKGIAKEEREAAERIRVSLSEILAPVSEACADKQSIVTGDMIRAVKEVCIYLHAEEKLEKYVGRFKEDNDPEREIEYSQIYDILMKQLDNMDSLIGDQKVSIGEFSELYEDALSEIRVGVIPPKSDVVMAGDLTRSRFSHVKALFFIGMTEQDIPTAGNKGGLISDADRQLLSSLGVEVAPTAAENADKERFYFYMNLMKPEELVSFSYPFTTLDGGANRESFFMKEARRHMGAGEAEQIGENAKDHMRFYSPDELYDVFSESLGTDDDRAALSLRALELLDPDDKGPSRLLLRIKDRYEPEERLTEEAGSILFGESFLDSPTELERFAACPFDHFLRYGLRLSERREFSLDPRDVGIMLHRVLELFSRRLAESSESFKSVRDEEADALLIKAIEDAVAEERIASLASTGARYAYNLERLKRYAGTSIDTLRYQSKQGIFDNIYFEKRFVHEGLKGTIDRCDEAVTDDGIYIDIIDYKTGNKDFDPDRIYYGLDIQLPLYMRAAMELRSNALGKPAHPAGFFYYHVDDPVIEGARSTGEDSIKEEMRKELKLRGVVNADKRALTAFDRDIETNSKSYVIPVGFKRNGDFVASSNVCSEEELIDLMDHTARRAVDLRSSIQEGIVSRSPYQLGKHTGCDYCSFREICDGGKKRRLEKMNYPEAWKDK